MSVLFAINFYHCIKLKIPALDKINGAELQRAALSPES
jgi:hypothetical protein